MKNAFKKIIRRIFFLVLPQFKEVLNENNNFSYLRNQLYDSKISLKARIYGKHTIERAEIGDYTYVGKNSSISFAKIGKFCSIGPNFNCGFGIHPTNGISTSPMFYANNLSTGMTFCNDTKVQERSLITIKNDVWIGMNVTILDGVTIGNGAVIGSGSVVTKDVPDYAIYGGVPAKLIRYRFNDQQIEAFLHIKWWDFEMEKLADVESLFFDVDEFISKYNK